MTSKDIIIPLNKSLKTINDPTYYIKKKKN